MLEIYALSATHAYTYLAGIPFIKIILPWPTTRSTMAWVWSFITTNGFEQPPPMDSRYYKTGIIPVEQAVVGKHWARQEAGWCFVVEALYILTTAPLPRHLA